MYIHCSLNIVFVVSSCINVIIFASMSYLIGYHVMLACRQKTTYEYNRGVVRPRRDTRVYLEKESLQSEVCDEGSAKGDFLHEDIKSATKMII